MYVEIPGVSVSPKRSACNRPFQTFRPFTSAVGIGSTPSLTADTQADCAGCCCGATRCVTAATAPFLLWSTPICWSRCSIAAAAWFLGGPAAGSDQALIAALAVYAGAVCAAAPSAQSPHRSILRYRVRNPIPSSFAALTLFPPVLFSASTIACLSISARTPVPWHSPCMASQT